MFLAVSPILLPSTSLLPDLTTLVLTRQVFNQSFPELPLLHRFLQFLSNVSSFNLRPTSVLKPIFQGIKLEVKYN